MTVLATITPDTFSKMDDRYRTRTVAAVNEIQRDMRAAAYDLARRHLRAQGYELGPMNRTADPKDWSPDWRERVIVAYEILKETLPGLLAPEVPS